METNDNISPVEEVAKPFTSKDKFLYYLVICLLNAVAMVLELVASRIMAPQYGNYNYVWTAIIGIILLSGSLGNLIGGSLSKGKDGKTHLIFLLMLSAIWIVFIACFGTVVTKLVSSSIASSKWSCLLSCVILFLFPSVVFGIATPVLMKELLEQTSQYGKESGYIHAIIAFGSLAGTLAGGFYFIPTFGSKAILVVLAALTIISGIILSIMSKQPIWIWIITCVSIISICFGIYFVKNEFQIEQKNQLLYSDFGISIDTDYGRVILKSKSYNGDVILSYTQDGCDFSGIYVDPEKRNELAWPYTKKYTILSQYTDLDDVMMIGGAGYAFPRYFVTHYDGNIDVVEIDPMAYEISRKYLYLDEFIEQYPEENARMHCITDDGRIFLQNTDKKYNAILNDAYSGYHPPASLATVEMAQLIKEHLKPGGVYMATVIGSVYGTNSTFLNSEVKTLQSVFKNVYILPVLDFYDGTQPYVYMLFATDSDYLPEDVIPPRDGDDVVLLTDNYCPVEDMMQRDRK